MSLDRSEVEKIARLACLEVSPEQAETYADSLSQILDLVGQMNAVDTSGIEPMAHPQETPLRMREDRVTEPDMRDRLLELAPASEDGLFLVPRVIE